MRAGRLLQALRRYRRSIVGLLFPALLFAATSGAACIAMPEAVGAVPHTAHEGHSSHAPAHAAHAPAGTDGHGHDEAQPPDGDPICPHCPIGHDVSSTGCDSGSDALSGPTPGSSLDGQSAHAATGWWFSVDTLPRPLLSVAAQSRAPPHRHVAVNIRHCVFLI